MNTIVIVSRIITSEDSFHFSEILVINVAGFNTRDKKLSVYNLLTLSF